MTTPVWTVHEVAAYALAVHIREAILEMRMEDVEPSHDFPVDDWRERYSVALQWAYENDQSYPDPLERAHQIQPRLAAIPWPD